MTHVKIYETMSGFVKVVPRIMSTLFFRTLCTSVHYGMSAVLRLSSSGVPSDDFYRNFSSACAVTVVIFGHLNRSFYLLTYFTFIKSRIAINAERPHRQTGGRSAVYEGHTVIKSDVVLLATTEATINSHRRTYTMCLLLTEDSRADSAVGPVH